MAGLSEAEILRARARCYLDWAITAREHADLDAAAYLTALAKECLEDAAALDAAEGKIPATQNVRFKIVDRSQ